MSAFCSLFFFILILLLLFFFLFFLRTEGMPEGPPEAQEQW